MRTENLDEYFLIFSLFLFSFFVLILARKRAVRVTDFDGALEARADAAPAALQVSVFVLLH